jgi:hypothetical protein
MFDQLICLKSVSLHWLFMTKTQTFQHNINFISFISSTPEIMVNYHGDSIRPELGNDVSFTTDFRAIL